MDVVVLRALVVVVLFLVVLVLMPLVVVVPALLGLTLILIGMVDMMVLTLPFVVFVAISRRLVLALALAVALVSWWCYLVLSLLWCHTDWHWRWRLMRLWCVGDTCGDGAGVQLTLCPLRLWCDGCDTLRYPCNGATWTVARAGTGYGSSALLLVLVVLMQAYSWCAGPDCGSGALVVPLRWWY